MVVAVAAGVAAGVAVVVEDRLAVVFGAAIVASVARETARSRSSCSVSKSML